jgi:hypothetical protein
MGGLSLLHLFLVEVASEVFEIGAVRLVAKLKPSLPHCQESGAPSRVRSAVGKSSAWGR